MTREEFMGGIVYTQSNIDTIYADHEEQLKAKDEEIEVLHSHLKTIDEDYSALASDFESAVMEIDRLKAQNDLMVINPISKSRKRNI